MRRWIALVVLLGCAHAPPPPPVAPRPAPPASYRLAHELAGRPPPRTVDEARPMWAASQACLNDLGGRSVFAHEIEECRTLAAQLTSRPLTGCGYHNVSFASYSLGNMSFSPAQQLTFYSGYTAVPCGNLPHSSSLSYGIAADALHEACAGAAAITVGEWTFPLGQKGPLQRFATVTCWVSGDYRFSLN